MHIASERNQHIKAIYCIIPTIDHSRKGKTMKTVKRLVFVGRDWGKRNKQSTGDF